MASRSAADFTPKIASRCVAPGSIGCGSVGSFASRSTTVEPFLQLKTVAPSAAVLSVSPKSVQKRRHAAKSVTPKTTESRFVTFMSRSVRAERALERDALDQREHLAADGELELLEGVAGNSRT